MATANEIKAAPGVPEVLAVIDMGSNAMRMVIAQLLPDGRLEVLERLQRASAWDRIRSGPASSARRPCAAPFPSCGTTGTC